MNEEEIIKRLTKPKKYTLIEILRKFKRDGIENYIITKPELVQGLLDLYNKEKERNKDLEQIEQEHKEENGRLRDRIKELEKVILLDSKPIILGMIPISRIKEKIEELTKIKGDLATYIATSERIKVLQELLEESEK